MRTVLGACAMVVTQVVLLLGIQLGWHRGVPDWLIEENLLSHELLHSGMSNQNILDQVIAAVRDQIGIAFFWVGAIAILVSLGWYCIAQLTEIHTPSHVDSLWPTWLALAILGSVSAALVTFVKLPLDVSGVALAGLSFAGSLVFALLFYLGGSLLWTPRPVRPAVPGAWRFSII